MQGRIQTLFSGMNFSSSVVYNNDGCLDVVAKISFDLFHSHFYRYLNKVACHLGIKFENTHVYL